jgi:hypothetical protein
MEGPSKCGKILKGISRCFNWRFRRLNPQNMTFQVTFLMVALSILEFVTDFEFQFGQFPKKKTVFPNKLERKSVFEFLSQ